jgi:DNA invertase Pin-like site-specific DNA recombinase
VSVWGIYLRLSKDDLRGGTVSDSNSIEGQRRSCRAYIDRIDPIPTVIEFAEDEFISASRGLDRPAYVRLLEAVAAGELDHMVARDQDRFTRDRDVEFGQLKALAKQAGVSVHAADSGPLFDSLDRELASGIRSEFGAFFAKVTGANTRKGLKTRREQGHWTGAKVFGYRRGGEINPDQAAHIRWAYDQILNHGKTARDVFEYWRANNVLTVNGKPWTSVGRVIAMLTTPTIAGLVTHKGEVLDVPARWEAIVTPGEQRRLKAVISANVKGERGHGQRKPRKHLLAGLVLCGNPDCDLKVMNSQDPGNGRPYYYWHCDRRRGGCGNRTRGPDLERLVRFVAFGLAAKTPAPEVTVPEWDDGPTREIEEQIAEVRAALTSRAMRAADAIPVLRDLNRQLAEQQAARDAHFERQRKAETWHEAQRQAIHDRDDPQAIRGVIDNVRVLPEHVGVIIEGTNGFVVEVPREMSTVELIGTIQRLPARGPRSLTITLPELVKIIKSPAG